MWILFAYSDVDFWNVACEEVLDFCLDLEFQM